MDNFNKAINYAFLLLKYRERSRLEFISRFKEKGYSSFLIKKIVKYLEENRLIDDKSFAQQYVLYSLEKGWGPKKIEYKLKKMGIADNLSTQELKNLSFSQSIKKIATQKLHYYQSIGSKVPTKTILSRISRFLLSQGFDDSQVEREVQNLEESNFEN